MVEKDQLKNTGSPKVEVGEIDTSSPFRSVKAAVTLFGEGALSGEKPSVKKTKSHSAERVLAKETQFHLAQKELNKLKEELKNAETLRSKADAELDVAQRTVNELTHKLKVVGESKDLVTKATEEAKIHVEVKGNDSSLKLDLETEREKYSVATTQLDAAKQVLRSIQQDYDSSRGMTTTAINQSVEAEHTAETNKDRVDELSKEIAAVQESISHVKLATSQTREEEAKIYNEKNAQKQLYRARLEELLALKKELDPQLSKNLETKLAEAMSDIEALQKVESLKVEVDNVKKEHSELKENEAETESVVGSLHARLQKAKLELELALAEEVKVRGTSEEMISTLHQLIAESEDAKHGAEEMKRQAGELKRESESTRMVLEEAEKKLREASSEAEEAKEAETRALEQIKILSERANAARTDSGANNIHISREEFESLSRKVEEADKLAEMKVAAAVAQVEAVKTGEKETMKRLEALQKEIDEMRGATLEATKKAEMAEAAKKAVETELRRWREREQKKTEEAASRFLAETEMMSLDSPQSYRIQKQNQPAKKTEEVPVSSPQKYNMQKKIQQLMKPESLKLEKPRTSVSKKALMPNLTGIFHRKRNQVEGGSPSYSPGERS